MRDRRASISCGADPGDLPTPFCPARPRMSAPTPSADSTRSPSPSRTAPSTADGSLFYPDSREFFDDFAGPYIPDSDVPPIWNPEFFGNTMVVNGRTWPSLEVEPRRYRFRCLNGCNSRFLILKIVTDPLATQTGIGRSFPSGRLAPTAASCPRRCSSINSSWRRPNGPMSSSTSPASGRHRALPHQRGPRRAVRGRHAGTDFPAADPETTGQVMKFVVVPLASQDTSQDPARLTLARVQAAGAASNTRQVSLNEEASTVPRLRRSHRSPAGHT